MVLFWKYENNKSSQRYKALQSSAQERPLLLIFLFPQRFSLLPFPFQLLRTHPWQILLDWNSLFLVSVLTIISFPIYITLRDVFLRTSQYLLYPFISSTEPNFSLLRLKYGNFSFHHFNITILLVCVYDVHQPTSVRRPLVLTGIDGFIAESKRFFRFMPSIWSKCIACSKNICPTAIGAGLLFAFKSMKRIALFKCIPLNSVTKKSIVRCCLQELNNVYGAFPINSITKRHNWLPIQLSVKSLEFSEQLSYPSICFLSSAELQTN